MTIAGKIFHEKIQKLHHTLKKGHEKYTLFAQISEKIVRQEWSCVIVIP